MITKKEAWVFMVYYGFLLLLLTMIPVPWSRSLTLSSETKYFGFEDDFNGVGTVSGFPVIVESPVTSGSKAVVCRNGDYIRWDLSTPVKSMDLAFNVSWGKLPTVNNESFAFGEIFGVDYSGWQDILVTSFYCDQTGYRGWNVWTGIPVGRGGFVSSNVVYSLETDQWYTIRMTTDLNNGTHKLYMDGNELAAIKDVVIPEDIYIDFFRLGVTARGDSLFVVYFDDVTVSLLGNSEQTESTPQYGWLPVQVVGIGLIGFGGYLWWLQKKDRQKLFLRSIEFERENI